MTSRPSSPWLPFLSTSAIAFAIFLGLDAFRFVDNGQNLVVFSWLGGVQSQPLEPGFHFIPPLIVNTYPFDIKTQVLTWKDGDPSAYDPRLVSLSRDGQEMRMELSLQFRVADAPKVFNSLGLNYIDYIAAVVRSEVYTQTTAFSAQALYSTQRAVLQAQIREKVTSILQLRGVVVQDLLVRDVAFSKDFVAAIEAKTIAENQLGQKEFEIQQATEDARTVVSQAQSEAGNLKAKADALTRNPSYLNIIKSQVFGETLDTLVTK